MRRGELEVLAVRGLDAISHRVECGRTSKGHGSDNLGRGEEVHSIRVAVVAATEVSVVRSQDSVAGALGHAVLSLPLTNTGTTGVGEDDTTSLLEGLKSTITLECGSNLLAAGSDVEVGSRLETSRLGVLEQTLDSSHVLVRAVGAATNETGRQNLGPLLILDNLLELGERSGQIGGEGAVDVRLQSRQVDSDEVVVLGTLVGLESPLSIGVGAVAGKVLESLDVLVRVRSSGRVEISSRGLGVWEDGCRGANLCSHVTHSSHTSRTEGVDTLSEVLNDGASASTDSEVSGETEDNILGGSPVVELADKLNTEDLGGLELPRSTNQSLNGISTADTDGHSAETTSVGAVGVGTKHHQSRKSVVLEDSLVNNTGTRRPKVHSILARRRLKEVENLLVSLNTSLQIILSTLRTHNQVVTVNAGGDSRLGQVARHELEDSHLGRGVLHVDTVRLEP